VCLPTKLADSARRQIAALPGVRSVAVSSIAMFSDGEAGFNITPQGYTMKPDEDTDVLADWISPDYFSTLETPLIAGREFTDADTAASPKVCIINQKLAQRFFAGRNPIGMRIARGAGTHVHADIEIVGVVANSKWDSPRSDIVPFMYMPYSQKSNLGSLAFYARTELDPDAMAAGLHSLMRQLDANLPVNNMQTLAGQVDESMFNDRLVAVLSISLALLAALLAASLLYGVSAYDPLTFLGVAILLAVVAGTACYLPARRATKVDPMVRCDMNNSWRFQRHNEA